MNFDSYITWIVGQIVVAAAIWGGIRSDIKSIRAEIAAKHDSTNTRIDSVDRSSTEAHLRIDRLLERRSQDKPS